MLIVDPEAFVLRTLKNKPLSAECAGPLGFFRLA